MLRGIRVKGVRITVVRGQETYMINTVLLILIVLSYYLLAITNVLQQAILLISILPTTTTTTTTTLQTIPILLNSHSVVSSNCTYVLYLLYRTCYTNCGSYVHRPSRPFCLSNRSHEDAASHTCMYEV